jgi:hypothetical protein
MNPKQRTGRKKKRYGPNIVRAWFDTVFHYALRALDNERDFLTKHDWTFQFNNRSLEHLGPFVEHVPAPENLDQFVSFFPEATLLIDLHDARERQLEQDCNSYYQAILDSPGMERVFQSVALEAPETLNREFRSHFGAYSSEMDFKGILAELLVNNVVALPNYYSTAQLWNRYRENFLEILSDPNLAVLAERTERSGEAMLKAVDDLASFLKQTRSELSLEFDVPPVAELNSVR